MEPKWENAMPCDPVSLTQKASEHGTHTSGNVCLAINLTMRLSTDFQYSKLMASGLSDSPGKCDTKDFMTASRWGRFSASVGTSSRNWSAIFVDAPDLPALDVSISDIIASINISM